MAEEPTGLPIPADADVSDGTLCNIPRHEWDAFAVTLDLPQSGKFAAFRKTLNSYQFQKQREVERWKARAEKVPGNEDREVDADVQAQLQQEYALIEAGNDSLHVKQRKKAQAALALLIDPADFVLGLRANIRKGSGDAISLYANLNGLVTEARKPQPDAPAPLQINFTDDPSHAQR